MIRVSWCVPLLVFAICPLFAQAPALRPGDLQPFEGCQLLEAEWADGDSFPVRFPDGKERTIRLYGVDCIEATIRDRTDADRLREQRRYFGIASGDAAASIELAKSYGTKATVRITQLLEKPFTVHTAFADARGDARYTRVYAFVTTADGKDLGSLLVGEGLARAYGVYRATPDGSPATEYREHLRDIELTAATGRRGVWEKTDWSQLSAERNAQRKEEMESSIAMGNAKNPAALNPNSASRDELMQLPGIGETMALRIIENREDGPYKTPEDLRRVPGIGEAKLESITPFLVFE